MKPHGKIRETLELGADVWNDSSDLEHLNEAISVGVLGATSNPVIVYQGIMRQKEFWSDVLRTFAKERPEATEYELAYDLIAYAGKKASELLLPVYEKTEGRKGKLSLQVNPALYPSTEKMVEQGIAFADLSPNITIKVPAIASGIRAMEELTALGISVNATVSFSIAQAVTSAEAIERGLVRARQNGKLSASHTSYVTLMVGRIEDYLRSEMVKDKISRSPIVPLWSGIAVFKKAHGLFVKRAYHSTLLSAAYRHQMHWTELIGEGVVLSMPYEWWKSFDASNAVLKRTLQNPVPDDILTELHSIPGFDSLMDEHLKKESFIDLAPSKATLHQFLKGQDDLVQWVRSVIL